MIGKLSLQMSTIFRNFASDSSKSQMQRQARHPLLLRRPSQKRRHQPNVTRPRGQPKMWEPTRCGVGGRGDSLSTMSHRIKKCAVRQTKGKSLEAVGQRSENPGGRDVARGGPAGSLPVPSPSQHASLEASCRPQSVPTYFVGGVYREFP